MMNLTGSNYSNTTISSGSERVLPPGYSTVHLILTVTIVTIIILIIVGGNLLVVVAIYTDKNLKSKQNWFIASLAVADCLLGLIIMPFSLTNEVMGTGISALSGVIYGRPLMYSCALLPSSAFALLVWIDIGVLPKP